MKNETIQFELNLKINQNETDIVRRETHEWQNFGVDVDDDQSRRGVLGKQVGHAETFLWVGFDDNKEAIYELFFIILN